jgi:hypothetical protein
MSLFGLSLIIPSGVARFVGTLHRMAQFSPSITKVDSQEQTKIVQKYLRASNDKMTMWESFIQTAVKKFFLPHFGAPTFPVPWAAAYPPNRLYATDHISCVLLLTIRIIFLQVYSVFSGADFESFSGVDPVRVQGSGLSLKFGCEGPQCIGPS